MRSKSKSALAGLLALLLLVAATFPASEALHAKLHQGTSLPGHFCLVCSFAQGQVSSADVTVWLAVLSLGLFVSVCLAHSSWVSVSSSRLFAARAPPRR